MNVREHGVSVVVLCHDYGRFLREAVESVLLQVVTELSVHEVVIVDDGSCDETPLVAARLAAEDARVRVITHPEARGAVGAANAGLGVVTGTHVLLLDADDRLGPGYLEHCLRAMSSTTSSVAYGGIHRFGAEESLEAPPPFDPGELPVENLVHKSALFDARLLDAGLRFDERLVLGQEDWAFWLDALAMGASFVAVPEVWLAYRRHEGGSRNTMGRRSAAQIHLLLLRTRPQTVRPAHVARRLARSVGRNARGPLLGAVSSSQRAAAQAVALLLQAAAFAVAARVLDGPGFTAYVVAAAVLGIAAAVAELGLPTATAVRVAKLPSSAGALVAPAAVASLGAGLLCLAVGLPVSAAAGGSRALVAAAALTPAFLVRRATLAIEGVGAGLGRWGAVSCSRVLGPLAALVVLVVVDGAGWSSVWAVGGALLVGELIGLVPLRPLMARQGRLTWAVVRPLLIESAPLGLVGTLSLLHNRLDQPLLGLLGARDALTGYAVAYRPVDAAASICGAASAVLLTRLASRAGAPASAQLHRSVVLASVIGGAAALVLVLLRAPLTDLLGGSHASGASDYLLLLAPAIALFAGLSVANQYVIAYGGLRRLLSLVGACTAGNLLLNVLLIPQVGGVGAGAATIATGALNLIGSWWIAARVVGASGGELDPEIGGLRGIGDEGSALPTQALGVDRGAADLVERRDEVAPAPSGVGPQLGLVLE